MAAQQKLLRSDVGDVVDALSEVNREVTESMDLNGAISTAIAHVWPTRKRRITHDMIVINFVKLSADLLGYMQIILILHALATAGRNWDHLPSIDQVFLPTFVSLGGKLFIFFVSFLWAWFSFVTEGGDPRLIEYDELHRLVRLAYHSLPLFVHGIAFLFLYVAIHCHLNNAHRGEGICKALSLETITVALCLLIGVIVVHYVLNFYQIFKHTQQPVRRRTFRSNFVGATLPLLGGFASASSTRPTYGQSNRVASSFAGAAQATTSAMTAPTLPDTATLPNTVNSNYAMGFEYGSGSQHGPV